VAALLVSPHVIDAILGFTLVEAVVLWVWLRRRMPGGARGVILPIGLLLLPGVCLMTAIRAALSGMAWPWVPAALAGALVAHLLDLWARWRR
jgi:hypothetical protein